MIVTLCPVVILSERSPHRCIDFRKAARYLNSDDQNDVEALIEAGADINARNYLGETPLIMAVSQNQNTRIFSQLISSGADITICDWRGHNVMEYARLEKRPYIITILKQLGL